MGRKKVLFTPKWTIKDCQDYLDKGIIGIINYHLHKDNTWIGYEFTSLEDEVTKLKELIKDGYSYDNVTYFKVSLYKLENPNLTTKEIFKYLIDYLVGLDNSFKVLSIDEIL